MLSLIPISDANPTKRFPIVTIGLIAANVIIFLAVQPDFGGATVDSAVYFVDNAPIPCQLEESCPAFLPESNIPIPDRDLFSFILATLYSTFLHAGILHIAGNMLFLWVFGNNIEDFLGPVKFLIFYLLGGTVAGFAHALSHLDSPIPSVGASGAVAAVMGAYLVMFPWARIKVLLPIFIIWTILEMSAFAVLGLWFLYQFLIGAQEMAVGSGVAWMAHVGGFVYGAIAIWLLGGRPHRPHVAYTRWGRGDYQY